MIFVAFFLLGGVAFALGCFSLNSESRCFLSFVLSKYFTLFKRYNDLFQLAI